MKQLHVPWRMIAAFVLGAGLVALSPASPASACGFGGGAEGGGVVVGGCEGGTTSTPGGYTPGVPYVPQQPPPPVYEHYYTPACSTNGPPGTNSGDVMCMGAAKGCQYREPGAIMMRHYQRQVGTDTWELVGTECRGPGDPTQVEPEVTQEMVLDQAFAAAPHPTAHVEPGARSYVNVPNNYWADAQPTTVTVDVLGNAVAVQFTIDDITWQFGDGATGSGAGVADAAVGSAGAVEHQYLRQGSYPITVTTRVGARFTLPNGQQIDLPGAFEFSSDPVVLPVGEIQTRVDSLD